MDTNNVKDLRFLANDYFPSYSNGTIVKIQNEQFSYMVGRVKAYAINDYEINDFLMWYWNNKKEHFITDIILNTSYNNQWKYFSKKINDFNTIYQNPVSFNTNLIENNNGIEMYENLINVVGINNFINEFIQNKYKIIGLHKRKNCYFKFAYENGHLVLM